MSTQVIINFPVADVPKSIAFLEALRRRVDPRDSDTKTMRPATRASRRRYGARPDAGIRPQPEDPA